MQGIVDRLLGEQMADGGWNCEQENGSTRGSFHSTINVLEGLLEHERATGAHGRGDRALRRGQEYLLERRMLRRLSTGELIDQPLHAVLVPDRLPLRRAARARLPARAPASTPDERMAEAIDLVERKRDADGRWPLENSAPAAQLHFEMDEGEGKPSRWNTLRAMRVLRWVRRAEQQAA